VVISLETSELVIAGSITRTTESFAFDIKRFKGLILTDNSLSKHQHFSEVWATQEGAKVVETKVEQ